MKMYLSNLLSIKTWACLLAINFTMDFTVVGKWFSKYIFDDPGFLKWLLIAMAVDLVTGVWKVIVKDGWAKVTSKGLRDTVSKCIQYGSFLIITHVLTHFEINGIPQNVNFLFVEKIAYEFLILIECKSVYENLIVINPKID